MLGNAAGRLVDRIGAHRGAVIGSIVGAAFVALLGFASTPLVLALVWTAGGAASALLWAGLNTIAVESSETNRAGVVSAYQASKFVGAAAAPMTWLRAVPRVGAAGVRLRGGGDAGGDPLHAA